ncbi:MAG: phosphoglycerate kinase [Synergistaceae bacterium]|nr:phosphoglycerate kinase [Synergistaceae bacterium]MBR0251136.1 phosphoglycerate kinase [Synergistaceae bacterium]
MKLKTFKPSDVAGKKVLMRVDFNVPFKNGKVTDDSRIRAHTSTLKKLLDAGAKVALVSHFGRPKGKVDPAFSLSQIVPDIEKAYGLKVIFIDDCVGPKVAKAVDALKPGEIVVLENSRYHPEEQKNDPDFSKAMAAPFDVFVMDAFSASHRADCSTCGVISFVKDAFAGDLLIREGEMLGAVSENPAKPYVLILGGAKVSDKIAIVGNLLDKADTILIGGGMAYTFLKAQGKEIGKSLCDEERLDFAKDTLRKAADMGVKILLPVDSVVASGMDADDLETVSSDSMPAGKMGLDIGPETVKKFIAALDGAKSVLWNGPMGVFEDAKFAEGTKKLAEAVAELTQKQGAVTVIGGGDTASAVRQFKVADKVSHVSTGGGASLEYCEGKKLPGMEPFRIEA